MKKNAKAGLAIAALLIAAVAVWFLSSRTQHVQTELPAPEYIETAKPVRMNFDLRAQWIGQSEAKQKISIAALTEGTVVAIEAGDEQMVDRGTILLRLSGPILETTLAAAREKAASLQERLSIAQDTMIRKQKTVQEKISPADDLASAKTSLEQVRTDLAAAKEQLQLLQDAASVTAPVSGIFTARKVSIGQAVEKGRELAQIIVPEQVRITATVLAGETSGLEGRQVTFKASDGKPVTGTIIGILPENTAAGGTVIHIEGNQLNERIRPGQHFSGQVVVAVHNNVLAVPTSAVAYGKNDAAYVFVKRGADYQKVSVKLGLAANGWVEVVSGIAESDTIVTQGAYELYYRDFSRSYKVAD